MRSKTHARFFACVISGSMLHIPFNIFIEGSRRMLQNQNNKDESYHESRAAGKAKMKKSFGLQLMILNKLSV